MRLVSLLLLTPALVLSFARPSESPNAGHATLAALVADAWNDQLRQNPEMATALGDPRYDDQLSDDSPEAYNTGLERSRALLERVSAMDASGLSTADRQRTDALVDRLVQQQADAARKPWELPISETSGLPIELPLLTAEMPFTSQTDYDHYLARLKKVPTAFSQITTNLMTGVDDHRMLPRESIAKIIAQLHTIGDVKAEDSVFAGPLQRFPAGIPAADRAATKDATLNILRGQVLPAYTRLARFLEVQYLPHSQPGPPVEGYRARPALVLALRARAEKELGPKFDSKAFRTAVMDAMPLQADAFLHSIEGWISQQH